MIALVNLIHTVISLYTVVLLIHVVLSWLTAFNVVNPRHQFVLAVLRITSALCEPILSPIRKILPNLGGIDISPIILILILQFLDNFIRYDLVAGF
jgi:YggT family protein